MKLSEIKSKLNELKIEELVKIQSYIPFSAKNQMINTIKSYCIIEEDNGMKRVNRMMQELITTLVFTLECTDIEIDELYLDNELNMEVAIDAYDYLCENGFYDYIIDSISNNDVDYLVDEAIQQELEMANSVGVVLNRTLSSISSLPSIIENLPNLINSINPQSVEMISKVFGIDKPNRQQRRKAEKESK